MMNDDELKPCPFCGGPAEVSQCDDETSSNWNGYYVECLKCRASTAVVFGEWQAVLYEMWNRRAIHRDGGGEVSDLKLNAYYYSFVPTGQREVDLILHAVARAGKAFHHTMQWGDYDMAGFYEHCEGASCEQWIQNAANNAAAELAAMTAERDAFKADSELLCRIVEAQFIDGLGDVDFHEEAAIAAAENGREEPNTRDYIAAWRIAMEAGR